MSTEIHLVQDRPRGHFEAIQFDGTNGADIVAWIGPYVQDAGGNDDGNFHGRVMDGTLYLEPGDWIIRRGQYYYDTITNIGFEKLYERIS